MLDFTEIKTVRAARMVPEVGCLSTSARPIVQAPALPEQI
jgi:hypothetical protein